jgi:hypothetical protein
MARSRSAPVTEKNAKEGDEPTAGTTTEATESAPSEAAEAVVAPTLPAPADDEAAPDDARLLGVPVSPVPERAVPISRDDLRKLAPRKEVIEEQVGRRLPKNYKFGSQKHLSMLDRGVSRGDLASVPHTEVFRVVKGGRVPIDQRLVVINDGARVTSITHDLDMLRRCGIQLELVDRA